MVQFHFTADLIQAFGWALLHSFWQAFVMFACLRLVLLFIPKSSAGIRYNLSYISLTGIFVWFIITLWQQFTAIRTLHTAAATMINTGVRYTHVELPAIYHNQKELTNLFPDLEIWFPTLVAIYIAGVAVMTTKLFINLAQLQKIRKTQVLPVDNVWEQHMEKLAQQLSIPRRIKLLISTHIQVPVMIGFLKPLILLPAIMFNNLTAEQLEAIILHELAHIKRNDYLLNIFQSIVETILFFNPFIWWISKNIRLEREHCCDDLVLKSQVQPLHYAKALVALEEYRLTVNALAMAAADNKQHLFYRIKRIMEMKTKNINYSQQLLAVLIIAVGLLSVAWLTPEAAQAKTVAKKIYNHISTAPAVASLSYRLQTDTVTPKREKPQQPEATEPAEAAEAANVNVEAAMQNARKALDDIDWQKTNVDISMALSNVDWEKVNKDIQKSMKNIDWKKINADIQKSMKEIDWKKINNDIKTSMKDAHIDQKQLDEAIKKGMDAAKNAMSSEAIQESIRQGMASAQAAMPNVSQTQTIVEDALNSAQQHVATIQMNYSTNNNLQVNGADYKAMIKQLTDAKLIDPEKGYKIEKRKDGGFYINDTKQSDDVTSQYSEYLKDVKSLSIFGKSNKTSISVEK